MSDGWGQKGKYTSMACKCFAERVDAKKDAILDPELLHHSSAPGAKNTGRVCFIHDEIAIACRQKLVHHCNEFFDRGDIAVHAVDGLDDEEDVQRAFSDLGTSVDLRLENLP